MQEAAFFLFLRSEINSCLIYSVTKRKNSLTHNLTLQGANVCMIKKAKRALVWFRQDLRIHDNEALTEALKQAEEVYPVFVFDTRVFNGQSPFGFARVGKYRAKFWIETVADLRKSFQALGLDLLVRVGIPEEELFKLAQELKTGWVFANMERTYEEANTQAKLEKQLWSIGQELRLYRGKMLYHTQDLPFPVAHTPDTFTHFRKEVEKYIGIREPLPTHTAADFTDWTAAPALGRVPDLADFGHSDFEPDPRAVLQFEGGETAGLARLNYYFEQPQLAKTYEETRNGMIGADYSTKFSAWLATGALSPKQIYHSLKQYEAKHGENKSSYWVFFELMWRDFFRLMGKKHGNKIFIKGGTKGVETKKLTDDRNRFERWAQGKTGCAFIDANMRELNLTGFMSNRGRQNVASYLVNDLKVNWQMGAEYFEMLLIDYDVCSNWGNWNYGAGVGNDPREDRYFNPRAQAKRYDPNAEYIKLWMPEFEHLDAEDLIENKHFSTL